MSSPVVPEHTRELDTSVAVFSAIPKTANGLRKFGIASLLMPFVNDGIKNSGMKFVLFKLFKGEAKGFVSSLFHFSPKFIEVLMVKSFLKDGTVLAHFADVVLGDKKKAFADQLAAINHKFVNFDTMFYLRAAVYLCVRNSSIIPNAPNDGFRIWNAKLPKVGRTPQAMAQNKQFFVALTKHIDEFANTKMDLAIKEFKTYKPLINLAGGVLATVL